MSALVNFTMTVIRGLDRLGSWFPQLFLRALVGWEYFEAGREKFRGENWFADIADRFPFPFSLLPVDASWFLATWIELLGGICIWLGLATRFWALGLFILTIVAISAVHWPADWSTLAELWKGYAITDRGHGNFKLPLILMVMLVPLMIAGPGRISIDQLIRRRFGGKA